MSASVLPGIALALPVFLALCCFLAPVRSRMVGLLWLAPIPALGASVLSLGAAPLVLGQPLVRVTLSVDLPGALLLGAASILWIAAGAYAGQSMRESAYRGRFAVFWLLTLTGSLGVFLAIDIAGFFLFYCVVSLAAWGLVVHDGAPRAWRAGGWYVGFAVLGETLLLLALILLAASTPGSRLRIADAIASLPVSPWRGAIVFLLIAGFGAKIALVPLHGWMPLTYRAAPLAAAAAMSGAAVKAGLIGLVRFLPLAAARPGWGEMLAAFGLLGAFWGIAAGIAQTHPKTILAYSSISQMGFIAAVLGLALAAGDPGVAAPAAFYAACHVLVKGGLFLAIGAAAVTARERRWPIIVLTGILGLGLAGLPFTGIGLAKLAVKSWIGGGVAGTLGSLAAAGTTLLMLHYIGRLAALGAPSAGRPSHAIPFFAVAIAGVVLPWFVYASATSKPLGGMLASSALWEAFWPVCLGVALALLLRLVPVAPARSPEKNAAAITAGTLRACAVPAAALQNMEWRLRQWPAAALSLLALMIVLGAALLAAG